MPDTNLCDDAQIDYAFPQISLYLNQLINDCKKFYDLRNVYFCSEVLKNFSSEHLKQKLKKLNVDHDRVFGIIFICFYTFLTHYMKVFEGHIRSVFLFVNNNNFFSFL